MRIVVDSAESVGSQSLIRRREKFYKTASFTAKQSQFLIDSSQKLKASSLSESW